MPDPKLNFPPIIDIGTAKWSVRYVEADSMGDEVGACLGHKHRLNISDDAASEAVPTVLIHEIIHALCYSYGIKFDADDSDENFKLEELLVNALGLPLLDLLRSNPELVKYLTKV